MHKITEHVWGDSFQPDSVPPEGRVLERSFDVPPGETQGGEHFSIQPVLDWPEATETAPLFLTTILSCATAAKVGGGHRTMLRILAKWLPNPPDRGRGGVSVTVHVTVLYPSPGAA